MYVRKKLLFLNKRNLNLALGHKHGAPSEGRIESIEMNSQH